MLLKDYYHTVYYVDRQGSIKQEDVEKKRQVVMQVQAEVIIKRENKHYSVLYRKQLEVDLLEYCADLLSGFLVDCRMEMEEIDKKWKLVENDKLRDATGRKMIAQTLIEL